MRAWVSAALLLSFTAGTARFARAEDGPSARCIRAAEEGQRARDRSRLLETQRLFRACSREACPAQIARDCQLWLSEVERDIPTVAFRVVDEEGRDVAGSRLRFEDGIELPIGVQTRLDPGETRIVSSAPGRQDRTTRVTAATAEKGRVIVLNAGAPVAASSSAPEPTPSAERRSRWTSPPVIALGAVALVALGSFAYFGLRGRAEYDELESGCGRASTCSQSELDRARAPLLIADVSAVAAILAGSAMAIVALLR